MRQISTTIEQGQRLIDAGISEKTADLWWHPDWDEKAPDCYRRCRVENIPAWSLSALWQMVHELDKTYEFPSRLSADELIENLVKTIIYRKTH